MATLSSLIGGRIKSIQRGSFSFGRNGTGTVTITSVDLNKSYLILSIANGHAGDGNDTVNSLMVSAYLSAATTISWASNATYSGSTVANGTCYWQVVELA